MWKRRKKHKADEVAEEEKVNPEVGDASSSEEEQAVSPGTEETPTSKEEKSADVVTEEDPSVEEEAISTATEEVPPSTNEDKIEVTPKETISIRDDSSNGVFIFGKKVEGGFKKFLTALFSIFLLPPVVVFGLIILTTVVLIILPITLLSLCILFIALPVVIPFLTVISLITGKGSVHLGLKNKKLAIKVLGITLPPRASSER
jgi:hypothetical protein